MAEPDLSALLKICRDTLDETRAMRTELRDARTLSLQNVELSRRVERRVGEVERRIDELKDDVETIIKAELGGRLAHVETRLEHFVHDLVEERVATPAPAPT